MYFKEDAPTEVFTIIQFSNEFDMHLKIQITFSIRYRNFRIIKMLFVSSYDNVSMDSLC